jgi:hypothetical protein
MEHIAPIDESNYYNQQMQVRNFFIFKKKMNNS